MNYYPGDVVEVQLDFENFPTAYKNNVKKKSNFMILCSSKNRIHSRYIILDNGIGLYSPLKIKALLIEAMDNNYNFIPNIEKYHDQNGRWIWSDTILSLVGRNYDGEICNRCKEKFYMAEANQPDGSFRCYLCRQNPYR